MGDLSIEASRRIFALVALAGAGAAAGWLGAGRALAPSTAEASGRAIHVPSAEIAVIATPRDPFATASEVRLVTIDDTGTREVRVATFAHAPGAVTRGDVLRGTRVVVIAADVEDTGRDPDWRSALYRVESGTARVLARGLYHASRPLSSVDGRVYVQRGSAGQAPSSDGAGGSPGRLRTDALTIDAIDATIGTATPLYAWSGYTLHLAGEWRGELLVYRVAYEGADLIAIERSTGKSRMITTLLPFARDFSVDETRGALVMSNRDEVDTHLWVVDRVNLTTGLRSRLGQERDEAPAAFALASGELASGANARGGLRIGSRTVAPLGVGFVAVTHASPDGEWMTVHHVANGVDVAAGMHVTTGTPARLTRGDERVEILGFVGASRGGLR